MEDWNLVRTKDGKAGWVLSRMLVMAIPDEVAQYSEGARITSYFMLGDVEDEGVTEHHWLWTTFRAKTASVRLPELPRFYIRREAAQVRDRVIERNIEGYYPIEVTPGTTPRFSLILRDADGKLYKKTWVMEGYICRKVGEELYTPPEDEKDVDEKDESISDKIRSLLDK